MENDVIVYLGYVGKQFGRHIFSDTLSIYNGQRSFGITNRPLNLLESEIEVLNFSFSSFIFPFIC